jgi:hypothetical protein
VGKRLKSGFINPWPKGAVAARDRPAVATPKTRRQAARDLQRVAPSTVDRRIRLGRIALLWRIDRREPVCARWHDRRKVQTDQAAAELPPRVPKVGRVLPQRHAAGGRRAD